MAASKLVAWREKDRQFIEAMLSQRLIDMETLRARVSELPTDQLAKYGLDHGRLLTRIGRLQTR